MRPRIPRSLAPAALAALLTVLAVPVQAQAQQATGHTLPAGTRFYVDPESDAAEQAVRYLRGHDFAGAAAMAKLASWPEADWFTDGTPAEVETRARTLARRAARTGTVPVLVAYNVPLRDCSQYSSGGAQSDAEYQAWIAALARGLGKSKAVIVLEPDALANLPSDCGPDSDPTGAVTAGRIADLNYAIDVLEQQPNTVVYLDAGNSHWQSVGNAAQRLLQAGVERAQGFSLNVSNFFATGLSDHYGTWVSKCLWYATKGPEAARGHADWCASQYYSPAAPNDGQPGNSVNADDPATWHWTDQWFEQNAGTAPLNALTHFVVDTSRNGQGSWTPPTGKYPGDPQIWCNPPGRGIGNRPTADTGTPLVDAYLWVKTVGQSDGQCNRNIPGGTVDPEYGIVDPPAGTWWPEQAMALVRNASPALTFAPFTRPRSSTER
ncbi:MULTISPECIES: glycoside hydrolase family 6 protein [unclassified Kitasatospora]|uniref:glycoside hydrolase family 6 protein n=1 Tax=unclassified Kitasatospora TaxID=2633591 RepID=UPI000709B8EC|nr:MULTISPECIES: glycoside hydrolase family 6 protein [unclassified Kitasatospora]KQV14265.1 glycoside hydrolase [Kitasatospora sp. Root107]KRB72403.1 glycoside hydrolase [Kitasatospora sp. Root187]